MNFNDVNKNLIESNLVSIGTYINSDETITLKEFL